MAYREQGKAALNTVLKQRQNIDTIEKYVYNISSVNIKNDEEIENIYKFNLYQIIGDILNGEKLKNILSNIKAGKLGWEHSNFSEMKIRMEEQDNFIENPFEVAEGVFECRAILKNGIKCGSKRVFSYTKQCRSSDEPESVFATCCACGAQWTYSG
jgi:DNA-directed RNA polymerase subunit M/transcription elongation factor TFIIS